MRARTYPQAPAAYYNTRKPRLARTHFDGPALRIKGHVTFRKRRPTINNQTCKETVMRNLSTALKALTCALFIMALSSAAQAQATRTWVSGVGADDNPCSRTAPCKTFAGAYTKTASGGEISVLDPGGYGTVNIGKPLTIDGGTGAGWGSILASGATGVIVNAGASDVVRLRNLSINGAGTSSGVDGIRIVLAHTVHVENVHIFRFSGEGIEMAYTGANAGRLNVMDTVISECTTTGILIGGSNTVAHAVSLDHVNITRSGHGLRVNNRGVVAVSNSVISLNNANAGSAGVLADSAVSGGAIIDLTGCQINNNSVGVQSNTNQAIRLSTTHMTGNGNALNFAGGTIASYQNNTIFGNAGGENFASLVDILQQ